MKAYDFNSISSTRKAIMGFAILWVVFYHSVGGYGIIPILGMIKRYGNLGVDIFLVLSGVGLFFSVKRMMNEGQESNREGEGKKSIWFFYRKRLIRIIPATVICLFPWYLYLYYNQGYPSLWRIVLDVTSLSFWIDGNNRGWYVALTIVLYAVYPFIYMVLARFEKYSWMIVAVLIIVIISTNTMIALIFPEWFGTVELALGRIPIFVIGCSLGINVYRHSKVNCFFPIISSCISIILVVVLSLYKERLMVYSIWRYLYGALGFGMVIVLSVLFSIIHDSIIVKIFSFVGKYTLEIYLTHTQILTVMVDKLKPLINSTVIIDLLAAVSSIIIAIIIHQFFSMSVGAFVRFFFKKEGNEQNPGNDGGN